MRTIVTTVLLALASLLPASPAAATPTGHYAPPCHERVRVAHGVPQYHADGTGMIQWEIEHAYTDTAAEYHADLHRCNVEEPVARWDRMSMLYIPS